MYYEIAIGILAFVIIISTVIFAIIGIVLLVKRPSPKKWLFRELLIWENEHIISDDVKTKIEKHYIVPVKERTPPIKIIIIIGSILLGIGLILFIASNWQAISGNIKLISTFTLSIIALLYGYYLKYNTKKPLPILGEGMLFLSTIILGATIIFLFQNFQISADNNFLLVFLWGAAIFPVAYFLKSDSVFYLSAILLFLSGIFYSNLTDLPNYYYLILGILPFLMVSDNK